MEVARSIFFGKERAVIWEILPYDSLFGFSNLIEIVINSSGYLADPAGGVTCILCHDA